MRRWRRNSDEELRRLEREAAIGAQRETDRLVVAKLRAGKPGAITFHELRTASPELIPREVAQGILQAAFDRLGLEHPGIVRLEWHGANVSMFESEAGPAEGEQGPLTVKLETDGIAPRLRFPGPHEMPRLRFYANEAGVETTPNPNEPWEEFTV